MRVGETRQFCQLQAEGQSLMRAAMTQLNLSAHTYHRVLKLARAIADLAGSEQIQSAYLVERATTVSPEVVEGVSVHRYKFRLGMQQTIAGKTPYIFPNHEAVCPAFI